MSSLLFSCLLGADLEIKQLLARNQNVKVLGGGWDHNRNNQTEFLILYSPRDSLAISEIAYYEESEGNDLRELWRYQLASEMLALFTDAAVTDLDGDHQPEIIALLLFQALEDKSAPQWLWIFSWDNETGTFSRQPSYQWNYRGRGISYLRPRQVIPADLDKDGNDELVIAIGSPDRMVLIAEWRSESLYLIKQIRSRQMSTGPWPFSIALADFNGDTRPDILTIGHGQPRTLLAYINSRDDFHEVSVSLLDVEKIKPEATAKGDLNGDGQEEVILSHEDGSLTLVNMTGPALKAAVLDTKISDLLDLGTADLDGDGASEIIYLQSDGTVTTNDTRFVSPVTNDQILSLLPTDIDAPLAYRSLTLIQARVDRPTRIVLPTQSRTGTWIAFTNLGEPLPEQLPLPVSLTLPPTPETVMDMETALEEAVRAALPEPFATVEKGSEVYFPDRPLPSDARALPPYRTPDILLYVGDEFSRNVLGERADRFAGFRFLRKPPNMIFNFQRQSIMWQPTSEHLGTWHVAYEITYNLGVKPEAMVTDSVLVPDRETVREQVLIYVNDKPRITSEPGNLRILAGHLFAYRIQAQDLNSDARIDYRLESGPDGMTIEPGGIVGWRTNETHHDDYPVVISVSDGFDKDIQTFTLNVNAKLTITSPVPHVAYIQKPYQYQVTAFQPGSQKDYVFSLTRAPEGMKIDHNGLISWTPTPAQIDTQTLQVRISDGSAEDIQTSWIYVNAQPKIVQAPPRSLAIAAGDTLRASFRGRDSNSNQPLQWNLVGGPISMTLDAAGNLFWPTSIQQLDEARYVVELSDGISQTQFKGLVFVNSPVRLVSSPPDSAIVGQPYQYPISIRDENKSSLLKTQLPTVVKDLERTTVYRVGIQDDKFKRDLPRYLQEFREMKNLFINKPRRPQNGAVAEAARIDLKQSVKQIFIEDEQLILVISNPERGMVELEDVLWELFQGGRGIMPKYAAERVPFFYYSLGEFPDGMTVDADGLLTWTPSPSQAGYHQVRLTVSDGFTRDEQSFQIYANYPPAIISQADTLALAEQRYTYRIRVDDKNTDAQLTYRLTKHPEGMKVDSKGLVTWIPSIEKINWQEFEVEVSDGHASDRQATTLFVNMPPRIISQPKPVALNNYEYSYRVVAEDLNRDPIIYRATKLPRYSDFDPRTGLFKWRPRDIQKGANDVTFEITDSHGGVTIHEFQIHVFEDPSRRRLLFTGWPLMLAFTGVIFVLGIAVGG